MEEIMVSVICTAYNHEKYIRQCLEGFVMQKTSFAYEVIVHDDASTDGTASIIKEIEEKYPDIIKPIYQTENQYSKGVRIGDTYIIPKIKGKYVATCEGDDYWCDANKLQLQVDFLESHPEYVGCTHNTKYENVKNGKHHTMFSTEDKDLFLKDCVKTGSQSFHTSSVIVKREYYINKPDFVKTIKGVGDYPNGIYYALCGPIHYFGRVMSVYHFGTLGSWTDRMTAEVELKNNIQSISMLKMADEYSDNKFSDLFNSAILIKDFHVHRLKAEYKELFNKKYKEVIKTKSCLFKLKYLILAFVPGSKNIYKWYRNAKNKKH